ncbi:hypothetical protein SDC9_131346 [bioreactor metagenome]|uniref:Uncharacterized protein n=1 Tax=bioreactor metagenome TaxID=1076179 RepID=A0A645D4Y2_9ZZZZ
MPAALPSRCANPNRRSRRSALSGVANSAAAVGVGARRSAAKSVRVKSTSCPTPLMTGTQLAATARTTPSSLKAHRSSIDPPPRAMRITSIPGSAFNRVNARMSSAGAASPCTAAGEMTTSASGYRRLSVFSMSCNAAPVGEVTMPIFAGAGGNRRLRSVSNKPSASSCAFRRKNSW